MEFPKFKRSWNLGPLKPKSSNIPLEGIDYTLMKTGQSRVFYVGHSQATAGLFALLSVRSEFNEKIIAMAAMCPFRYFLSVSLTE